MEEKYEPMDKNFLKELKDKEWIYVYYEKDNDIRLITKNIKGWPKNLDTENFEIESITPTSISGYACGDWQDATTFNISYNDDIGLYLCMFNSYTKDIKKTNHYKKEICEFLNDGEPKDPEDLEESKVKAFNKVLNESC